MSHQTEKRLQGLAPQNLCDAGIIRVFQASEWAFSGRQHAPAALSVHVE